MKTIKEILDLPPTKYTGSKQTFDMVASQIESRFGKAARKRYDPKMNTRTFVQWVHLGYKIKKGERPLESITFIEKKNASGEVISKFPRKIYLWFISQVERVNI
jgi:hypothetical protein